MMKAHVCGMGRCSSVLSSDAGVAPGWHHLMQNGHGIRRFPVLVFLAVLSIHKDRVKIGFADVRSTQNAVLSEAGFRLIQPDEILRL